jgi:hypothetical protein
VARAILADGNGEFAVRAVTRHRGSESARRLAKLEAEVDLAAPAFPITRIRFMDASLLDNKVP